MIIKMNAPFEGRRPGAGGCRRCRPGSTSKQPAAHPHGAGTARRTGRRLQVDHVDEIGEGGSQGGGGGQGALRVHGGLEGGRGAGGADAEGRGGGGGALNLRREADCALAAGAPEADGVVLGLQVGPGQGHRADTTNFKITKVHYH